MGRKSSEDKIETSQKSDYTVCLDAAQQSTDTPMIPFFGSTRLTCFDGDSNRKSGDFHIPGQIVIKNADKIDGCVLQMRVILADKKDSEGNPLFYDIKIKCPNFEPTSAFVNGKRAKMSIQ